MGIHDWRPSSDEAGIPGRFVYVSTVINVLVYGFQGPEGTAYQGLSYRLSLNFTGDYPFKAPHVRFETGCFHPNVDQYGNICLDILKEKWSAAYSVKTILQSIQSLLADANIDSPLNSQAANMWEEDPDRYRSFVEKMHSSPPKSAP